MSALPAETSLYPECLFDVCDSDQSDRRWWAIYTKARQEKALARELFSYEVPFYLPLVVNNRMSRGRCFRSYLPLFTGYIFLFGNESERVIALTTNRVSRLLHVDDQQLLTVDLFRLQTLISTNAPLSLERHIETGTRVRVTSGPLQGVEGVVVGRQGRRRLLVTVTFLQTGATAELDNSQVELIG